ncbi:MAG TPA: hypothetical protein VNW99_07145 [Cytophagaceae bacterium]|jgi:hypothetical protein|nr:hypothetical protein [Cytophagaceae bacterium]
MKKIILSITIIGVSLCSCETTKESANISDTPAVMTGNSNHTSARETMNGKAWSGRNPQFPGVPGPTITSKSDEEREKVTSNKAGRR